jgi:hypothetical protein
MTRSRTLPPMRPRQEILRPRQALLSIGIPYWVVRKGRRHRKSIFRDTFFVRHHVAVPYTTADAAAPRNNIEAAPGILYWAVRKARRSKKVFRYFFCTMRRSRTLPQMRRRQEILRPRQEMKGPVDRLSVHGCTASA